MRGMSFSNGTVRSVVRAMRRRSVTRTTRPTGPRRALHRFALGALAGAALVFGVTPRAQHDGEPRDEMLRFIEVLRAVRDNYVDSVNDRKLITYALNGALAGLDPHSMYLDSTAFIEMQNGLQGEFAGLGLDIGHQDGYVKVIGTMENSPAMRGGIEPGDLVIKIDDKSTQGLPLNDAVRALRGPPQSAVVLTVLHTAAAEPVDLRLVREIIEVPPVKSKLIEPGVGYLRIIQFQPRATEEMVRAIESMQAQAPLNALVLDLRNDPGGVMSAAVGVSAAFLPANALIVSTQGRMSRTMRELRATPEDYSSAGADDPLIRLPAAIKTLPLVVLVNRGSASASEIVAGALQDHRRAVVLGTTTFGKGSVQSVLRMTRHTAIKLTTARYYTPLGRSIQARGIVPDLVVNETADGDGLNEFRLREADLHRHLNSDLAAAADAPVKRAAADPAKPYKPVEFGSTHDYQLQQALKSLKGQPVSTVTPAPAQEPPGYRD